MIRPIILTLLILIVRIGSVPADNWPMWRGPRGDGTSSESGVPLRWSSRDNIAWKVKIPGVGHASPIVWEDRVFIVTCLPESQHRVLLCLDRTSGDTLWQRVVIEAPLEEKHRLNSRASSTPATDGELVYVAFLEPDGSQIRIGDERYITPGNMVVAAYDFSGQRRWLVRPGLFSSRHGFCSNPVPFENRIIVNGDHDGDAYLVALDRQTGQTLWKTPRENKTRSYSTPIIRSLDGRTQMVLSGNLCVASYDPRDGSQHWIIDGPTEQFVASVVDNGQLVFVTAGYPEYHILAIRPDGHGKLTDSHIEWRTTKGCAYVPSPIVIGPYLFVVSDTGIASLFDTQSGKRFWMERIGKHFSASVITAGGHLFALADDGTTSVIKPGPTFERIAQNAIGESCSSSPAISKGQIFVRGEEHLYCIGTTKDTK